MMFKRRMTLLLSFILICTPMHASINMIPLRQLVAQENAKINYYKTDGLEYVDFYLDGVKLVLNLTTGVVTDELGKYVDVKIKVNNNITYVSSEELLNAINNEKTNSISNIKMLSKIISNIVKFVEANGTKVTKTYSNESPSTSISDTDSNDDKEIKSEMSNIYIKTFRNDNIFYTTDGSIKIDTTTSSGINVDVNNLFIKYGISIKEIGYQDFSSEVLINGEKVDEKKIAGKWGDTRTMYSVYLIQDINLRDNDIIELRSNGWEPLRYVYKEDKQGFKYIEHQDDTFTESAERSLEWRLKYLFGSLD